MAKTLRVNVFSASSIRQLKKDLIAYRDSIDVKLQRLVDSLLETGINTAIEHSADKAGPLGTHKMGRHVYFSSEPIETVDGTVHGIMLGEGDTIVGRWFQNDGHGNYTEVSDTINALMVLEFGTAALALEPQTAFGVVGGQGTKSRNGHENDFAWKIITRVDKDGNPVEWKDATAIQPTQPMYHAGLAMYEKVKETALAVFAT